MLCIISVLCLFVPFAFSGSVTPAGFQVPSRCVPPCIFQAGFHCDIATNVRWLVDAQIVSDVKYETCPVISELRQKMVKGEHNVTMQVWILDENNNEQILWSDSQHLVVPDVDIANIMKVDLLGVSLTMTSYQVQDGASTGWIYDEFSRDHYGILNMTFEEGDIVMDIGAHQGWFSILVAKIHPQVRVISVEASPKNAELLMGNLEYNDVPNVNVIASAICAEAGGHAMLNYNWGNPGMSSLHMKMISAEGQTHLTESMEVSCTTMEELLEINHIDQIKLLKVDCEGCEYDLFGDGPEPPAWFKDKVLNVVGELHDVPGKPSRHKIEDWMFEKCTPKESNPCQDLNRAK